VTPRGVKVVALSVVLGSMTVLLSGCDWSEVLGLGWPRGITPEAHLNRELWIGSVIASLVVGVIVWGLIFWTSAFHRHKKGDTELPRQFGYNMPLELVLTVVPFLIISVLFYFTVVVQEKMLHEEPDPEVVVDVTAFQWNWKFGYQKVNYADGTLTYEGGDPERKAAVASGPEGEEGAHGGEFGVWPSTRSRRWGRPPRFPFWWCPWVSVSSSRSRPPTSSTVSGCRSSCSSAT
jgi:cytochrome c oxidase subunit II